MTDRTAHAAENVRQELTYEMDAEVLLWVDALLPQRVGRHAVSDVQRSELDVQRFELDGVRYATMSYTINNPAWNPLFPLSGDVVQHAVWRDLGRDDDEDDVLSNRGAYTPSGIFQIKGDGVCRSGNDSWAECDEETVHHLILSGPVDTEMKEYGVEWDPTITL
jgi:hypothetical protein